MAFKFVFSQMFDIRPKNESGDLDLEKIKKIEKILNLKITESLSSGGRIINLKPQIEELEIFEKLEGGKSSVRVSQAKKYYYDEQEPLETSAPDRSEIFSILETIESAEQFLKKEPAPEEAEALAEAVIEGEPDISEVGQEQEISETFQEEDEEDVYSLLSQEPDVLREPAQRRIQEADNVFQEEAAVFHPRAKVFPYDSKPAFHLKISKVWPARILGKYKSLAGFLIAAFLIFSFVPAMGWFNSVLSAKANVLNQSMTAYQSLILAKDSFLQSDFPGAEKNFQEASRLFASASSEINQVGGWLVYFLENIPGFSFFSSRTNLIKSGEELSKSGEYFAKIVNLFENNGVVFSEDSATQLIFSSLFGEAKDYLDSGFDSLVSANYYLQQVKVSSLPEEIQPSLASLKEKLPEVVRSAGGAVGWANNFLEIFGEGRAKKYLLVFQNNAEMRATGGFIGTYGVLDLDQGQIKNLSIDGIFNLDGQLIEKVIPPRPIQKISTAWSTHDANWFADFPTSAKKLMWFYEKAGGPTVDGVIAITPTVVERLLEITGPIEMPEYGVTLTKDNFAEITQYKVEVDYDKELNQPKRILADFAPKFIQKISQEANKNGMEILEIISQCLKEKHVLVYFSQSEIQEFAQAQGWAGEILKTAQDYFSVVNSNINGFKTDRVIEEKISYYSEIQGDGSIIDTLQITRHHLGGGSQYDWYNQVNADYLRVYLPKGTQLISAKGQTRENYEAPIDYQTAGFKLDADVLAGEQSLKIDEESGTQIFEESGKTVFGNWVFVSPGETVTLIYKYRLPFKLDASKENVDFSVLAQKQSGSQGSKFFMQIKLPTSWEVNWFDSENLKIEKNLIKLETDLGIDRFVNFIFNP